jgi:hypothetical protein
MTERLFKETLKKLYIKEKKTVREIAEMHDCPDALVRYRLRKCGIRKIPILPRRIVLKKSLLQEFYIKDGKSTREIAKSLACSPETVRQRCKEHEIEVRPQGGRTIGLDKPILQRLYVKEA